MKICRYLRPETVFPSIKIENKDKVLRFIAESTKTIGLTQHSETIYQALLEREQTMSTGIGKGLAFPHAFSGEVDDTAVFLIHLVPAIDFQALDGLPVDIVIALIVPEGNITLHLQLLAGVSRLCKNEKSIRLFRSDEDPDSMLEKIRKLEDEMIYHP